MASQTEIIDGIEYRLFDNLCGSPAIRVKGPGEMAVTAFVLNYPNHEKAEQAYRTATNTARRIAK